MGKKGERSFGDKRVLRRQGGPEGGPGIQFSTSSVHVMSRRMKEGGEREADNTREKKNAAVKESSQSLRGKL